MFKQRYGRPHRTYTGYRRRGISGRCTKCSGFLSRVSELPPEIKQMIGNYYKTGLRKRMVVSRNKHMTVKKRLWKAK